MTPLAQAFMNDLLLPRAARRWHDTGDIGSRLTSFHFFECSHVMATAKDLAISMIDNALVPEATSFLPAPMTWIESQGETDGSRNAFVLILREDGDADWINVKGPLRGEPGFSVAWGVRLPLRSKAADLRGAIRANRDIPEEQLVWHREMAGVLYGLLAMINTPRIIGRRQHMPHAGLQRKLAAARGMVGKFPLQAWTEIILEVTPPVMDEGEPHEARLTGGKALHFCRSHLRVRRGQLELVKAHWRGDPALGIKRSRYSVVPPKNAA
jgi:hypothetical protein